MSEVALAKRYGKILSASMPCSDLDFLTFLRHAQGQARFLWASPKNERVIAGFGSAVEISSWGERRIEDIEEQVKDLFSESKGQKNRAKLFGGFAFQDDFSPENAWANFAPAQFILPHYQFDSSLEGSFLSDLSRDSNIVYSLYIPFSLPWQLTGVQDQVEQTNRNIVLYTEAKFRVYGLDQFLRNKLEFYQGG